MSEKTREQIGTENRKLRQLIKSLKKAMEIQAGDVIEWQNIANKNEIIISKKLIKIQQIENNFNKIRDGIPPKAYGLFRGTFALINRLLKELQ